MSRTVLSSVALAAAAGLTALATLGTPAHAATTGKELDLTFEGSDARTNAGTTSLTVRTLTANGGRVRMVAGESGGSAIRLPAFADSNPPLALLEIIDEQGADDLSPGTARFRYGADFTLDPTSQGSTVDNGNNLLQRGSFRADMQYKVEVDGGRPGCRVKGSAGAVAVRSPRTVVPGDWYRATCLRDGSTLTLTVRRLADGKVWRYSRSGQTGSLQAPSRSLPLSVGGKLTARGTIAVKSSDQFNGRVDNAFLNVLS
jgi:hypothetical protein